MKKEIKSLLVIFTLTLQISGFAQTIPQTDLHRAVTEARETGAPATGNYPLQKDLLEVANQTWVAFQHSDWATMRKITTPDFVFVGAPGIQNGEQMARLAQLCKLNTFTLHNVQVRTLDSDSAVLVYTAHQDFSCNGQAQPSSLLVADSLTRKNGKWLVAVHVETVIETAP
jgi:hypothetical protein